MRGVVPCGNLSKSPCYRVLIGKKVHMMLRTRAKFFVLELMKVTFFFTEVSRQLDIIEYYNHYCILLKGCHSLPPGVQQEKGTGEVRFGSGSASHHLALHS